MKVSKKITWNNTKREKTWNDIRKEKMKVFKLKKYQKRRNLKESRTDLQNLVMFIITRFVSTEVFGDVILMQVTFLGRRGG